MMKATLVLMLTFVVVLLLLLLGVDKATNTSID